MQVRKVVGMPVRFVTEKTVARPARVVRRWLAVALAMLAASGIAGAAKLKARQAVVPIFVAGHSNAAAVLRVDRFFTDHRRMGFFRVQLLPLFVADGVRLELGAAARASNSLAELPSSLERLSNKTPVELRSFKMSLAGEKDACVEARRGRLGSAGGVPTLVLEDATVTVSNVPLRLRRVGLPLTNGPLHLAWERDGTALHFDPFTRTLTTKPCSTKIKLPTE